MLSHTLNLDTLKGVSLEELIFRVLNDQQRLTILVSDEQEVIIEPKQKLKPLPILDGTIPAGWKDAIYDVV